MNIISILKEKKKFFIFIFVIYIYITIEYNDIGLSSCLGTISLILILLERGDVYEKDREKPLSNHYTPYYCDNDHVNKNSTNCIKSVLNQTSLG